MGERVRLRETGEKQNEEKSGMICRKKDQDYMENEFRRKTRGL